MVKVSGKRTTWPLALADAGEPPLALNHWEKVWLEKAGRGLRVSMPACLSSTSLKKPALSVQLEMGANREPHLLSSEMLPKIWLRNE